MGAGVVGAGLLAGCANPVTSSVTGAKVNPNGVTYWNLFGGGDGANMITMEDAYRKKYPNVPLQATTLAWGDPYYTKVSLATAGGQPPDVAISHLTRMPLLGEAGVLTDLNTLDLASVGITQDKFTPQAWQKAHVGDKLYAIPLDTHVFVMYYNTELAAKTGIARADGSLDPINNGDDFLAVLTELKKATGHYGMVTAIIADPATNWRWFDTLYSQQQGQVLGDNGQQVLFDTDKAEHTLAFMQSLSAKGLMPVVDDTGVVSVFSSGQAGILLDGNWQIPTYQATPLKFNVVPIPNIGGPTAAAYADSHSLVIPTSSKRSPEATAHALQLIRTLLDNSLTWAGGGHVPAWLPVQQSAAFKNLKPQSNYVQAAYQAKYDPQAWYTGAGSNFQTTMGQIIASVQSGGTKPQDGAASMRTALDGLAKTRPPVQT